MKFIDLFAGIGGFHLALSKLGCECVFASEIDKYARDTYKKNFNIKDEIFNNDIRKISPYEIPNHDILCAGFPCQPFSQAGYKRGFSDMENSERGTLFFCIADILKAKRPRAFILENVRYLINHSNGETFRTICDILSNELNYSIFYKVIKASDFGRPQHRPRVYIVGFSNESILNKNPFNFPDPIPLNMTMSDIWEGECNKKIGYTLRVGGKGSPIEDRRNWDGYVVNDKIVRLGPIQAKRMMGFPDNFILSESTTQSMKQLGNSVCVDVVYNVAKQVLNHMSNNEINSIINTFSFTDISKYWNKKNKSNLVAVDLFCGCGGISKGLELAGINVIAGLDFFKEAGETYTTNFDHRFVYGDITKYEIKEEFYKTIKEELKGRQLNIVAAGFPCQGFSMAGRRDLNDPRNKLYLEVVDIVKTLNPEFIFLENVKGLISIDKGKVKKRILEDFRNIGYEIQAHILNAADFETPQKRERVVFIGNRIGKKILYPHAIIKNGKYKTTKDAIEDLIDKKEDKKFSHFITKHSKEVQERLMQVKEGKGLYANYSDSWKKCPWNEASCTIKENHGGVNIHPKLPRVLTVRECARIQSFPDDFLFKGTKSKQLVQIGNAVPPNLSKAVGLAIRKSYEEN